MLPLVLLLALLTAAQDPLSFHLRHQHAVSDNNTVLFSDVRHDVRYDEVYSVQHTSAISAFTGSSIRVPDVQDRETLLLLAKMTNNAYLEPDDKGWYPLGDEWSVSYPIGWDDDGFRGHVFATSDNNTIILAIKGTSATFIGSDPTSKKDKLNDNLLFSCCCARVDFTWSTVCDCYRGSQQCDLDCLERSLIDESLFYTVGTNLYNNLTYMYPDSQVWIVGHSLGGALASLLGVTFGVPVVAFEAPGEMRAAHRLHLPSNKASQDLITHVYHTADPAAMGTCNGILSACWAGGFAMETRCHMGKAIIYDTVNRLGWSATLSKHGIVVVINDVLNRTDVDWEEDGSGREVPLAKHEEEDCMDTECYSWDFGSYGGCSQRTTPLLQVNPF